MVSFETVLNEINNFGFYQKFRYFLICIAALLPPIGYLFPKFDQNNLNNFAYILVTYLHSFTSPNVPHRLNII